jgi:CBS domain containing-hemolysin-like protein
VKKSVCIFDNVKKSEIQGKNYKILDVWDKSIKKVKIEKKIDKIENKPRLSPVSKNMMDTAIANYH